MGLTWNFVSVIKNKNDEHIYYILYKAFVIMMMMNFLEKYSDSVFLYSIFINDEQKCLIQSNKRMMMRYIVCVCV